MYSIYYKNKCLYSELSLKAAKDLKEHLGCKEWIIKEIKSVEY